MPTNPYDDEEDFNDPANEMVREILAEMLSEALGGKPTPIVLPAEIITELSNYCREHSVPKEKLIPLAMKDCKKREDEFVRLMAEYEKDPDEFEWPADPLDCLVIAFLHEATKRFQEKFSDPDDEPEPADWWKQQE